MFLRMLSGDVTILNSSMKNVPLKKKGNVDICSFDIKNKSDELQFDLLSSIEVRRIPLDEIERLSGDMCIIQMYNESSIMFQPMSNVKFIKLNDDGHLEKINYNQLQADDSILIFDEDQNDYVIDDVKDIIINENVGTPIDSLEDEEKEPKNIGNYVINTNKSGVIINNFFMC